MSRRLRIKTRINEKNLNKALQKNHITEELAEEVKRTEGRYNPYTDTYLNTNVVPEITVVAKAPRLTWTSEWSYNDPDFRLRLYHINEGAKDVANATRDKMNQAAPYAALAPLAGAAGPLISAVTELAPMLAPGTAGGNMIGNFAKDMLVYEGFNHGTKAITGTTLGDLIRYGLDKVSNGYIPASAKAAGPAGEVAYDLLTEAPTFTLGSKVVAPMVKSGVRAAGRALRPAGSYVYRNGKYILDHGFNGVPTEGNMEAYVPTPVKANVERAAYSTMRQMEDLGAKGLPEIKFSYENMPLVLSNMGKDGVMHVGFDSKTLHNPVKYYRAYTEKPGLGINYSLVGGHEPAHLMHANYVIKSNSTGTPFSYTNEDGIMITSNPIISGPVERAPIGQLKVYKTPEGNWAPKSDEYYEPLGEATDLGWFKGLNTPRQNIMPGLPNTPLSQAHLRAPMEMDADLYALNNLGHINNGQVDEEGIKFLMQRHNLSKEDVLLTIADLKDFGYANAVSGEPIDATFNQGLLGAGFGSKPTNLSGDGAIQAFRDRISATKGLTDEEKEILFHNLEHPIRTNNFDDVVELIKLKEFPGDIRDPRADLWARDQMKRIYQGKIENVVDKHPGWFTDQALGFSSIEEGAGLTPDVSRRLRVVMVDEPQKMQALKALGQDTPENLAYYAEHYAQDNGSYLSKEALMHEVAHLRDAIFKAKGVKFPNAGEFGFDTSKMSEYMKAHDGTEILARGTQIKNAMGISDKTTEITGRQLYDLAVKWRNMGMKDNGMYKLFTKITDWNKAAKFISRYSLSAGIPVSSTIALMMLSENSNNYKSGDKLNYLNYSK